MQINYLPAGGAVVAGEREFSPVTLYTKQRSAHKRCSNAQTLYARLNKNCIQNFLKTVGFHKKYSDIKTPALGFKRAELNQAFSPPGQPFEFPLAGFTICDFTNTGKQL